MPGFDASGGAPELPAASESQAEAGSGPQPELEPPPELEPQRCVPAPGTTGRPSSIAETVDLVNGLPKPVSLACFLEALERPLRLVATRSFFSAQPAVGARSPRIFLFMDGIIQSIVPEGTARNLLEMGEATTPGSSIKAELEFPIDEDITLATAFERLPLDDLTTCGVCHNGHVPVLGIDGAFESEVLRPADRELVPLTDLENEAQSCDAALEPERCAMLGALFQHGDVIAAEFPRSVRTIFD
ncbi:MAG TPA: hypothetical protein VMG12_27895 [Polyangiaceae bacterium]|nr:hypothetical protein [Polyangiaceae bacterium]